MEKDTILRPSSEDHACLACVFTLDCKTVPACHAQMGDIFDGILFFWEGEQRKSPKGANHIVRFPSIHFDQSAWATMLSACMSVCVCVCVKVREASQNVAVGQHPVPLVNIKIGQMDVRPKWSHRLCPMVMLVFLLASPSIKV